MKKYLLVFLLIMVALPLFSQKDTTRVSPAAENYQRENQVVSVTIFPVPVRNNTFTINADREITYVKITNIIGQDIFRNRFSGQTSVRIDLDELLRCNYTRNFHIYSAVHLEERCFSFSLRSHI